jgi:response regulator of citrate/malate metabolism
MSDGRKDDDALRTSDARFRLGASDYLTKPIDWGRLGRALGRYRPAAAPAVPAAKT